MSNEPAPYRPPPIGGSPAPGLRWDAVGLGVLVDTAATFGVSLLVGFVAVAIGTARHTDPAAVERYLEQLQQAPDFVILTTLLGLACVVAGGYVCGRVAGREPRRHALVMGLGSLAVSFGMAAFAGGPGGEVWSPLWFRVLGYALVLPAALFGGWLAAHRTEEAIR